MKEQTKEDKIKETCEVEERRSRVDSISHILEGIKYKTESDRAAAILGFAKSTMTIEEIAVAMAPGKPDYLAAQVYRKGVF